MEKQLTAEQMQKLYNYLAETFNCMPLESEMRELIDIVSSLQPTEPATEKEPDGYIKHDWKFISREQALNDMQHDEYDIEQWQPVYFSPVSQTKDTKEQKGKEIIDETKARDFVAKKYGYKSWLDLVDHIGINEHLVKYNKEVLSLLSSPSQQPADKWDKINKAFDSVSDEEFKECINNRKLQQSDSSQTKGLDITDEEIRTTNNLKEE